MNILYIIGNGFDLHHGIDTKYATFAEYMARKNSEMYEKILNYYRLPDITKEVTNLEYSEWALFEDHLARMDYELILDDNSHLIARPSSSEFRDRDWHAFQIEMEMLVGKLTEGLCSLFNSFILSVAYPFDITDTKIRLDSSGTFLNFNYTNTLERFYGLKHSQICYIHNKSINASSKIILGHGTDPDKFREPDVVPPEGLNSEELERWNEDMNDRYDYSFESAKEKLLSYYARSFKNSKSITNNNRRFFDRLSNIDCVYVLGHAISQVDIAYFETVLENIKSESMWHVSYFGEQDKIRHINNLQKIGIKSANIIQFKINDLLLTRNIYTETQGANQSTTE